MYYLNNLPLSCCRESDLHQLFTKKGLLIYCHNVNGLVKLIGMFYKQI